MSKQTAVEWLAEKYELVGVLTLPMIERAKAMEREQMIEAWETAHQAGRFEGKRIAQENWQTFEQYYNETYKGE